MFYWILLILVWSSSPKCMSYWKGDTYFSADVLGNSYCRKNIIISAEIITWPISNLTASQYVINDAIAQSLYG